MANDIDSLQGKMYVLSVDYILFFINNNDDSLYINILKYKVEYLYKRIQILNCNTKGQ